MYGEICNKRNKIAGRVTVGSQKPGESSGPRYLNILDDGRKNVFTY